MNNRPNDRLWSAVRILFPSMRAEMARRILINYRVDPRALRDFLPRPFRPKQIRGWGLAGICLIRLEKARPAYLPAAFGVSSENAAHRIAVTWIDHAGQPREGVFIPRRDTNSRLAHWAGGRLFPGVHHAADIQIDETDDLFNAEVHSRDSQTSVRIAARRSDSWPDGSVFESLDEASTFFRAGCRGWSSGLNPDALEGVELWVDRWEMRQLTVTDVESSFYSDKTRFPAGSVELDSAFLMRKIPHTWRALDPESNFRTRCPKHRHGPSALFEMP